MSRLAFLVDVSSCSGCKTCQVACQDAHGLEPLQRWRRVVEVEGGAWRHEGEAWQPDIFAYSLSLSCQHCASPACVVGCPTGAVHQREDGTVGVRESLCIGCRYCSWACPYGAPQFAEASGTMSKCDFCEEERRAGRDPICVAACPLRAIGWGEHEELRARPGVTAELEPLPGSVGTNPSMLFVAPRGPASQSAGGARANDERSALTISNAEEIGR